MLLSAADGIVGRNRTPNRGGDDEDISIDSSSCMAGCRISRGLPPHPGMLFLDGTINGGNGVLAPLERDNRNVDVLAVVAVVEDESFRLLDKLLSCDVFRISQELCRLRGSSRRSGTPQLCCWA